MRQSNPLASLPVLSGPVLELCAHLEERGLRTFSHGEGLLAHLRIVVGLRPLGRSDSESGLDPSPEASHSLLCSGSPEEILRALPRAVVTAEGAARLTQATESGPVDILCSGALYSGADSIERTLTAFGLGPFGFAFRPANEAWVDPKNQRAAVAEGRLELLHTEPNPFLVAPRRYWIAARLIAENSLSPSPACLAAATQVLETVGDRLPQAAPARREVARILAAPQSGPGLAFLREAGVGALLFPGTRPANEERIAQLPRLPAVRWAAWLGGAATARVLVRLRTPHDFARRVERLQAHHPIERVVESGREHGIRRLLQKLDATEISALLAWRRLELAAAGDPAEIQAVEARLVSIEMRIAEARTAQERTGQVRALRFKGEDVMRVLGAGPGRHVGQALTHLAHFVAGRPELNTVSALEAELTDWARKNTNLLD